MNGRDVNGRDVNGRDVNDSDVNGRDVNGRDVNGRDVNGRDSGVGLASTLAMISMDRVAACPYPELFGRAAFERVAPRVAPWRRSVNIAARRARVEAGGFMHVRGFRLKCLGAVGIRIGVGVRIGVGSAALLACSGRDVTLTTGVDRAEATEAAESLGQLDLPLVTPGKERYRLRRAIFDVTHAPGDAVASLDGEADPNAPSLSLDLSPGSYVVTLEPGWLLEHLTAVGAEPVSAALISPEAQAFDIRRGQATDVRYVFSTIGGPLTLGASPLTVHTEVTAAAALPGCDVLDPLTCPESETCLLAGDDGKTFCARAGSLSVGAACSAEQCVAGAQCMYLGPAQPPSGVCAAYCSTQAPPPGCECQPLQVDARVGVCIASGACANGECAGRVLVAGAPVEPTWNLDVQAKLVQTGAFVGVDVFDVSQSTPSVEDLERYSAVLVYTDALLDDADALGDHLADYFDGGGRVVVAAFANATVPLGGRWASDGYALVEPLGQAQALESAPLGVVEAGSPLLAGVTSLTATAAFGSLGGPINGGVVVATWGSGAPLIVRGVHGDRARVDLDLYPPSGDVRADFWRGSGAELLRNALMFQ